jgi:hypothetical protein
MLSIEVHNYVVPQVINYLANQQFIQGGESCCSYLEMPPSPLFLHLVVAPGKEDMAGIPPKGRNQATILNGRQINLSPHQGGQREKKKH